jgi:hypothetical protein
MLEDMAILTAASSSATTSVSSSRTSRSTCWARPSMRRRTLTRPNARLARSSLGSTA